jgi:HD superfamily phosphohydrolase
MDADRMDYLLRDSHHAGVHYGRFDLHRVIGTVTAIPAVQGRPPKLGIQEGGWHGAEALVMARYLMFTQVYFHKTRVAYDIHLRHAMKEILPGGQFPKPEGNDLVDFLNWDDWRALGMLADGKGGEHGERLRTRNHYRKIYHTAEVQTEADPPRLESVRAALGKRIVAEESAAKSWYKTGETDIPVLGRDRVAPLSEHSTVIKGMKSNNQVLVYCRKEEMEECLKLIKVI